MADLNLMAIFARVVEAGSFSEAARRMGCSRSAVSKAVAKLEKSLGAHLLNRTTRYLSLTEIGAAVAEHCSRILDEATEAENLVGSLNSEARGVLRVSASVAFGTLHVAPALAKFLPRHPKLKIDLSITDRWVNLAEEGYDVAIHVTGDPSPIWWHVRWHQSGGNCAQPPTTFSGKVFRKLRPIWSPTTAWTTRAPESRGAGALPDRRVKLPYRSTALCMSMTTRRYRKPSWAVWGSVCCPLSSLAKIFKTATYRPFCPSTSRSSAMSMRCICRRATCPARSGYSLIS